MMFVLLFAALKVAGQTTGYLRFDTVRIMKQNGTCELYIINKTKDSLGLLTNIGGGLTTFKKSRILNDSTFIVGNDTLKIIGAGKNITNSSNKFTGNYIQNADHKQLIFDSVGSFRLLQVEDDEIITGRKTRTRLQTLNQFPASGPFFSYGLRNSANTVDSVLNILLFNAGGLQMQSLHSKSSTTLSALAYTNAYVDTPFTRLSAGNTTAGKTSVVEITPYKIDIKADSLRVRSPKVAAADSAWVVGPYDPVTQTNPMMKAPSSGGSATVVNASGSGDTLWNGSAIKRLDHDATITFSINTNKILMGADTLNWVSSIQRLRDTAAAFRASGLQDKMAFPPTNGLIALGDSYYAGYNADAPPTTIRTVPKFFGSYFGVTFTNYAVSGNRIRDQLKQLYSNTTTTPTTALICGVGFNNFRARTDSTRRIETAKAGYRSIMANQFAKTFEPPFGIGGVANPKYTFSASTSGATAASEDSLLDWSSHTYWVRHNVTGWGGANWWKKTSITANETITIDSLEGSALYIQTWACDNSYTVLSRIQYAVDGVTLGTYDPRGKCWSTVEAGFIRQGITNDAIVITGLRDTLHRIVLTFLDGGVMGGIDGVGVLMSTNVAVRQPAFLPAFPHMNATGYAFVAPPDGATAGSLDTATAICKAELQSKFPGYPIYFPAINRYFDPTDPTQQQSDGIHPTSKGQYNMFLAYLDEISPQKIAATASTAGASTDNLDDVTTRGATTANAITITGNSSSAPKLRAGSFELQPSAVDNGFIGLNVYNDGSTFRYRSTGYASAMHYYNGQLAFRAFGTGSAGADAVPNLTSPLTISVSSHVGIGGNMTFDDNLTGATLIARSDGFVKIPTGKLLVGQSSYLGLGTLEVAGPVWIQKDQNSNTYLSLKNGTAGTSAQTTVNLNNDVGDLLQQGIYSSATNATGGLVAGIAYIRGSGSAGLALVADNASGPIKILRGSGFTETARWNPGGELQIGSTTDQGAFTLQNTGGLYQNGSVSLSLGSDAAYDIYYRNASGLLTRLAAGTAGQVLTTNGTSSAPSWSNASVGLTITSGRWLPTITNVTNVDGNTIDSATYTRIGDIVTYAIEIVVDPTATTTLTELRFSLPVASDFSATHELIGSVSGRTTGTAAVSGTALADATNNVGFIQFISQSVNNHTLTISGQYKITPP
jgi:hypothetical protein